MYENQSDYFRLLDPGVRLVSMEEDSSYQLDGTQPKFSASQHCKEITHDNNEDGHHSNEMKSFRKDIYQLQKNPGSSLTTRKHKDKQEEVEQQCMFSALGCSFHLNEEKSLEDHLRDDMPSHLQCVLKTTLELAKWQASELRMQSSIYQTLLAFCHKHVKLEQRNRDLERKLDELQKLVDERSTLGELEFRPSSGAYYWRVQEFSRLVTNSILKCGKNVYSGNFYTKTDGYCVCLRMTLEPTLNLSDVGVGLFIHFVRGNFDKHLPWPFQGTIKISIMDQNTNPKMRIPIVEHAVADEHLHAFRRASEGRERNPHGFGYKQFVTTCILQSGSYIQNDTLIIKCEVTSQ